MGGQIQCPVGQAGVSAANWALKLSAHTLLQVWGKGDRGRQGWAAAEYATGSEVPKVTERG